MDERYKVLCEPGGERNVPTRATREGSLGKGPGSSRARTPGEGRDKNSEVRQPQRRPAGSRAGHHLHPLQEVLVVVWGVMGGR